MFLDANNLIWMFLDAETLKSNLGHDPRMLKSSIWMFERVEGGRVGQGDLLWNFLVVRWVNLKIEDFNILGHDPRMLKTLNSKFCDLKTSNS